MSFTLRIAIRHLTSGRGQTALTVAAVAVAVTVVIFITSLIDGLQRRLLKDTIGALPHVTAKPREREPEPLSVAMSGATRPGALYASAIEKQPQQRSDLSDPDRVARQLAHFHGVRAVAPAVRGQAFLIHGTRRFGVTVSGADPASQEKIVALQENIVEGHWLDLAPEEIAIGFKLAQEAGVRLADRVTLRSDEGVSRVLTVGGIFNTGQNGTDLGMVFTNLRAAQGLFNTRRDVTAISVKLIDPFEANAVADQMAAALNLKTESWMREQATFVNGLRAQSSSSSMISAFALLASAFSIAAVLIVSVLQKRREIGILKSMGARDGQILSIFVIQGLGVALVGSALGSGVGYVFLRMLAGVHQIARAGKVDQLFPVAFDPMIFVGASAAAVVATLIAAWYPARKAAALNPVEIIHG